MYRVLIRYSFDGDDGSVTTPFWNALAGLGFADAGTGLKRANALTPTGLQQFFQLLATHANGTHAAGGLPVTVDHFLVVVESH